MSFKVILESHERELLDDDTFNAWRGAYAATLGMPGAASWWAEARPMFTVESGRVWMLQSRKHLVGPNYSPRSGVTRRHKRPGRETVGRKATLPRRWTH